MSSSEDAAYKTRLGNLYDKAVESEDYRLAFEIATLKNALESSD